jgi:hypothetical protein
MNRQKRRAALSTAALSAAFAMVVAVAPAAHADSSSSSATPLPVSEPALSTQSKAEAVVESVTVSQANSPRDLNAIRANGAAAIAKRQRSLTEAATKIASQPKDCGFNAAMQAEISRTSGSLNSVGVAIATTTDLSAAKLFYGQIFTEHRVYLVVTPKANAVLRCDAQLVRNDALLAEAANLQAQIDAAAARGVNVAGAQATKNAAVAQIAQINPAPAVANVMGLAPDRGDKAVQAANATAFKVADAALDASLEAQRAVNRQLDAVRKALRTDVRVDAAVDRAKEKADRDAKRAAERAAKDAEKAAEKAKKAAEKAVRNAQRNAERTEKEARRSNGRSNDNDNDDNDND